MPPFANLQRLKVKFALLPLTVSRTMRSARLNHALESKLWHLFDIRPGEARQVVLMAALLFFLLAANNVIKVVRDALFLSRFPITQLPYVYLLAALVAGGGIATYARYTARLALSRIVLGSLALTIASAIAFWFLVVFSAAGWVLYGYYVWSAIAGLVLVAQFWMIANGLFNPRDGKRLFGIITAGGTIGATLGGLAANWLVRTLFGSAHLLWLVVALLAAAFALTAWILGAPNQALSSEPSHSETGISSIDAGGILQTVLGSSHLKTIAALIFVSVVVSTLIDYQFKAAAKQAYPSADALARFFGSYYAWLGAVTLLAQAWLTGKLLVGLGLTPSLLFLPGTLLAGAFGLLLWPGLAAATATRMAEATLRTSVHQSGMQILFLPVGDAVKKRVKVFLDVVVERLGDGVAALIILSCSLVAWASEMTSLSYAAIAIILGWIALVTSARAGYVDALRRSLAFREGFSAARRDHAPIDTEVPSALAVRQAIEAAAHGKYPEVLQELIARLGVNASKAAAREALTQYGETAVKPLRNALFDNRIARDIRLNIPRTLGKIPTQAAMNALMGGLLEEDRGIRFKVILAIEEMSRRFPALKVDRDVVESAIMSDAQLYCRRLVFHATLFDRERDSAAARNSLLYHALRDSIDRVLERVMWLLALIYPATDIRRAWAGLQSADRLRRAHATEFIDNLLAGDIKKYLLPLYSDAPPEQKLRAAFDALGLDGLESHGVLRALLTQEDRWLRAAALWEIGLRKLGGFSRAVAQLAESDDRLVRETALLVAAGQAPS